MQIAPLSATFSITTWRAIKCNADTGSETFSPSYLSPCRIAINFKYEILPSCISIRIAIDSRQVAIANAVYRIKFVSNIVQLCDVKCDIYIEHYILLQNILHLWYLHYSFTVDFAPLQIDFITR